MSVPKDGLVLIVQKACSLRRSMGKFRALKKKSHHFDRIKVERAILVGRTFRAGQPEKVCFSLVMDSLTDFGLFDIEFLDFIFELKLA